MNWECKLDLKMGSTTDQKIVAVARDTLYIPPITVTSSSSSSSNSSNKCKLHDTAQSMLTYSIRLLITPSINTVQKKKTMVLVICGE
jgi:hypothetical protein